ncbi:MAG: bifunctional diaminohydroxyphosphoribosylaminopyrimidine deaminase/5-amino-6-(5-phosphoribosylamino)uracil reductase RibD, partial [Gammaproteobacteria bacterium]|nr:bifunctional diaminohydroxyphosphoribosylaminopyrimidine deaminase/5-amino-6-(5-phosphoribosylamino)uracil reductase RibD [Gammaproteobacteria bacterium]
PNPNVGCVLVNGAGEIVGEGWHQRAGQPHAEPLAIAAAGDRARGTTAYVTLEPCNHHGRTPPCAEALISAGVTRVVAATEDPNPTVSGRGYDKLREAGLQVEAGLLEEEAVELNIGYTRRMRTGRPWVRAKLAVSADGRTSLENGRSQWIAGAASRADVHHWRARSSAILTGSGTVLADDPSLNARIPEAAEDEVLQPVKVVADSHLAIPVNARLLTTAGPVLVAHAAGEPEAAQALVTAGAEVMASINDGKGRVDLAALLDRLGERSINEVMVEAGPRLNGALLEAGLIDEIIMYQAASLLGSDARGMFTTTALTRMDNRYNLQLRDIRRFGDDVRMIYRVTR